MRRVLPLLAVLSLAFAPAPFPKPAKPDASKVDLKKMQGKWLLCLPHFPKMWYLVVSIKGDLLSFEDEIPPQIWRLEFPPGGNPKRIDLHLVNPGGNRPFSSILRGIYRMEDDTVTIGFSFSPDEKDRPVDLDKVDPSLLLELSHRTDH